MAIKGKSKPKGSAKTVTRGPKPVYVPVHKPFMQRRAFWWTILGIVVLAAILGIWYGLAKQKTADREDALAKRLATSATQLQQAVDPILAGVGQALPPSSFETFAGLHGALNGFVDGTTKAADLDAAAAAAADAAHSAATDLEAVDAVGLVAGKGFEATFVNYVLNAQSRMVQALKLDRQSGLLSADAAAAPKEQAVELASRAREVADLAKELFADGYQDYVEVQFAAGIYQTQVPTGVSGA